MVCPSDARLGPHRRQAVARILAFAWIVGLPACGQLVERGSPAEPGRTESGPNADASSKDDALGSAGADRPDETDGGPCDACEMSDADESKDASRVDAASGGAEDGGLEAEDADVQDADVRDADVRDGEPSEDSGGGTAATTAAIDPALFTWAYDASELCLYGATANWPAAAGDVILGQTFTATTTPPSCNAATTGLRLDAMHTDHALALNDGGCWASSPVTLPSLPRNTRALLRVLAWFPEASTSNRYLLELGPRPGVDYLQLFHRRAVVFATLRTTSGDTLTRISNGADIRVGSWSLVDVLIDAGRTDEARIVLFVNGVRTEGPAATGVGDLEAPQLVLGYRELCDPDERIPDASQRGNQALLFLGMAIGSASGWFDDGGEAHQRHCQDLGLCPRP